MENIKVVGLVKCVWDDEVYAKIVFVHDGRYWLDQDNQGDVKLSDVDPSWVNDEDYIGIVGGSMASRNQLIYDRKLNRVMDNSKILEATGMKQSELMPLEKGLSYELSRLKKADIIPNIKINDNMDKYLAEHKDTKMY